jgi:hypothetical protein
MNGEESLGYYKTRPVLTQVLLRVDRGRKVDRAKAGKAPGDTGAIVEPMQLAACEKNSNPR